MKRKFECIYRMSHCVANTIVTIINNIKEYTKKINIKEFLRVLKLIESIKIFIDIKIDDISNLSRCNTLYIHVYVYLLKGNMSVCMYVMYVCVYIYMYILCIYVYICVLCMYICIHDICMYICVFMYVRIDPCMYVRTKCTWRVSVCVTEMESTNQPHYSNNPMPIDESVCFVSFVPSRGMLPLLSYIEILVCLKSICSLTIFIFIIIFNLNPFFVCVHIYTYIYFSVNELC